MSKLLQSFSFQDQPVRVEVRAGQEWWVAKDVCRVLGISNSRDAVARLDDDERGVVSTDSLTQVPNGGPQLLSAVNESGLFTLILGSRKPEAKAFKRWVTHEVLPQLRRTGSYSVQQRQPDLSAMTDKLSQEEMRLMRQLAQVRDAKAILAEAFNAVAWLELDQPSFEVITTQPTPPVHVQVNRQALPQRKDFTGRSMTYCGPKIERAKGIIRGMLQGGEWVRSKDLQAACVQAGISPRTADKAMSQLGVLMRSVLRDGVNWWERKLP